MRCLQQNHRLIGILSRLHVISLTLHSQKKYLKNTSSGGFRGWGPRGPLPPSDPVKTTFFAPLALNSVSNKNLWPLVKPDDQTNFYLAQMIFQLAQNKIFKNTNTLYSKFTATLNYSNTLERIFKRKSENKIYASTPIKI